MGTKEANKNLRAWEEWAEKTDPRFQTWKMLAVQARARATALAIVNESSTTTQLYVKNVLSSDNRFDGSATSEHRHDEHTVQTGRPNHGALRSAASAAVAAAAACSTRLLQAAGDSHGNPETCRVCGNSHPGSVLTQPSSDIQQQQQGYCTKALSS